MVYRSLDGQGGRSPGKTTGPRFVRGPAVMVLSAVVFSFMGLFSKRATDLGLPGQEVAFFRSGFGVAFILLLAFTGRTTLRSDHTRLLVTRGIVGGIAFVFYFTGLGLAPLTNVTVLHNAYPLFAALFAVFLLGERMSAHLVLALVLAAGGTYLLLDPRFISVGRGEFYALGSAMMAGISIITIRQLRLLDESSWRIYFHMSLFGALFALVASLPAWITPRGTAVWTYLALTAVLGLAGQMLMTYAFKYCTTLVGSLLSMTAVFFTALLSYLLLGEVFSPQAYLGALLVVSGTVCAVILGDRK